MIQMMRKMICGVGPDVVTKSSAMAGASAESRPSLYLPKSKIPANSDTGVGVDGSCWAPWRESRNGEMWFQRISNIEAGQTMPAIKAFDSDDDAVDWDEFDRAFEQKKLWVNRSMNYPNIDEESAEGCDQ
ncbi:hypothetical protein K227x_53180 [Rubripirellula lacrimiformis]|uniref:Uncharacterized protein n=2 Tax=Rubripirellula lacrimiformis TaxID=1930273 RepID=A0A517NID5_9BACT|nr:hypothetical protein K227x_53180 [Rubripirellula lacrimiformis]